MQDPEAAVLAKGDLANGDEVVVVEQGVDQAAPYRGLAFTRGHGLVLR